MPIVTLVQLEARLQETHGLNPRQKEELLHLISDLKQEIAGLSKTHEEHAHSIARFTDISAHEATRRQKNQDLLRIAMAGLSTEEHQSQEAVVEMPSRSPRRRAQIDLEE
jgi:hypothetical protein